MIQQLFLKWLESNHPALQGLDVRLGGVGLVYREHPRDGITALTLFEPRDLTEKLLGKLKLRMGADPEAKFKLQVPPFLKHRAETLLQSENLKHLNVTYSPFLHLRQAGGRFSVRGTLKVACVDDSPVLLKVLKHALEEHDYVRVVGQTSNPETANAEFQSWQPDVVTMDIQMPRKNGVQLVTEVMESNPLPVIMVSSLSKDEGSLVFDALNAGAFDYIQKPKLEERAAFTEDLHERILEAAIGKRSRKVQKQTPKKVAPATAFPSNLIWVLGSSTGGTQALTSVFTALPDKIPPTLVVQHIPPVFSKAFADSLNNLVPFTVKEAEHGDLLQANHVYIAPGGLQMGVEERAGGKLHIVLADSAPVNRFKPSVDYMFDKVVKLPGMKVVAGLLTGMGKDGAEGLLALRRNGAHTLAQDEATSAVYGMPRAAAEIGAAESVVPLEEIAHTLMVKSQDFHNKRKSG